MNRNSRLAVLAAVGVVVQLGCDTAQVNVNGGSNPTIDESRIIGGETAESYEFPWMMATFFDFGDGQWGQGCGGSLIDPLHVLTAAHCSVGYFEEPDKHWFVQRPEKPEALRMAVRPQSIKALEPTQFVQVKKVVVHPDYDSKTTNFDYAVLELEQPVYVDRYPSLPNDAWVESLLAHRQLVTVSGYGTVDTKTGATSDTLLKADVPLVPNDECAKVYDGLSEQMICAGFAEGGKDSCQGDSGGPLFVRTTGRDSSEALIGIVSFGEGCALPETPGVYARVSKAMDWINQCLAGDCPTLTRETTTCATGYQDCDGNKDNGCELFIADKAHCGKCADSACADGEACYRDGKPGQRTWVCKPAKAITPQLACVFNRPDGKQVASFGYESDEKTGIAVIEPGPLNLLRGSTTTAPKYFFPGQSPRDPIATLEVPFAGEWMITGPDGQSQKASVSKNTPVCEEDPATVGEDAAKRARQIRGLQREWQQ